MCQDNLFQIPEALRVCDRRIHFIRTLTPQIPKQYDSGSKENMLWSRRHFEKICSYLTERQKWLHSPMQVTLGNLREDFAGLLAIYATKTYGEFTWNEADEIHENSKARRVRYYVKIVLLLLAVIALVWLLDKANFQPLGYMAIAFIMYLIDDLFQLNILKNVLETAKALISISK
jgi:hypothetical protein